MIIYEDKTGLKIYKNPMAMDIKNLSRFFNKFNMIIKDEDVFIFPHTVDHDTVIKTLKWPKHDFTKIFVKSQVAVDKSVLKFIMPKKDRRVLEKIPAIQRYFVKESEETNQ